MEICRSTRSLRLSAPNRYHSLKARMDAIEIIEQNEKDAKRLLAPAISDWIVIAQRLRRLTWEVLEDATTEINSSTVAAPQLVAHYLCTRLEEDLRAALLLVEHGHAVPALSLESGMLEFAFTIGWIGESVTRAKKWREWKDETSVPYGTVKKAIRSALANGRQPRTKHDVERERMHYTLLCELKHGNPTEPRQFGVDLDDKGRPQRYPSAELHPEFIEASRLALYYGIRYLWLGLLYYNEFHSKRAHYDSWKARLDELNTIIERARGSDATSIFVPR